MAFEFIVPEAELELSSCALSLAKDVFGGGEFGGCSKALLATDDLAGGCCKSWLNDVVIAASSGIVSLTVSFGMRCRGSFDLAIRSLAILLTSTSHLCTVRMSSLASIREEICHRRWREKVKRRYIYHGKYHLRT